MQVVGSLRILSSNMQQSAPAVQALVGACSRALPEAVQGTTVGLAALATATGAQHFFTPANIWCIGRNYAEHAKELGNDVPTEPMIFLKAGSTACRPGTITLPSWSLDVHHEVELAIELGPDLQPTRAAVSLDLTARDVQAKLKKQQWPWTLAKSFKHSTPLGPAFSLAGVDVSQLALSLEVNGTQRQRGHARDMIFNLDTMVAYVKKHFPVQPGDVLLTGTPPGVSRMQPGDTLLARVHGPSQQVLSEAHWTVDREQQ